MTVDPDTCADLHAVQAHLNNGAIVALSHTSDDEQAALLDELTALLSAAAISCAHAATGADAVR